MEQKPHEIHLDVYHNRYELHNEHSTTIYLQGPQNADTQRRYAVINEALANGFLAKTFSELKDVNFSLLSEENQRLLRNLVNGITSEVGRALVGLAFLQLTIKTIAPTQSIRLHKGTTRRGCFSWVEGISMRTIDSHYNTPFLREYGLLNLNKFGVFMTRSLAENYPYTSLYKAEMKGPFRDWIAIVDAIEDASMPCALGLSYLMALLKNRSAAFQQLAQQACQRTQAFQGKSFDHIKETIKTFYHKADYSARAFEVALHSFYQAMDELHMLGDADVVALSQMRSANKKHGNIGDIELTENGVICEAWDAKYGKPYLRDELEELRDKLLLHPDVKIAGFIVDGVVDIRRDIVERTRELALETGTSIHLFSIDEWMEYELSSIDPTTKNEFAYRWLLAIVESFSQKRLQVAPIDEPCDAWLRDLIDILGKET